MKRRNFLQGASALTLGSLLVGCRQTPAIKIELLKNSVPVQMVSKFRQELKDSPLLDFVPQPQLQDLFGLLQKWKQSGDPDNTQNTINRADLVMIGDYWLVPAIQQNLIQPLDSSQWQQWSQLPPQWQTLVKRNAEGLLDPQGQVWGAPYRWGSTVIIYRKDRFKSLGWTPQDWSDLWREEVRDRISVLDHPREVIGLTLKKLGASYNTTNLNFILDLEAQLQQLHQNIRLYDSDTYLKPLITGDTWLAVGWSTDIPVKMQRQHNLGVVVPASGTALWTDVWVQPASQPAFSESSLAQEWIDFCWKPEVAKQMSLLTGTTSPVVVKMNSQTLPEALRNDAMLFPKASILDQSEFLQPLPQATLQQYGDLWVKIRTQVRET